MVPPHPPHLPRFPAHSETCHLAMPPKTDSQTHAATCAVGEALLVRPAAEPVPDLDDEPPPRFTENDPVELEEDFDDAGLGGESMPHCTGRCCPGQTSVASYQFAHASANLRPHAVTLQGSDAAVLGGVLRAKTATVHGLGLDPNTEQRLGGSVSHKPGSPTLCGCGCAHAAAIAGAASRSWCSFSGVREACTLCDG